jgi:hypothetical protein
LLLSAGNDILLGPATAAALKNVVNLLFFFFLRNARKAWRDGGALEGRGKKKKKTNERKYTCGFNLFSSLPEPPYLPSRGRRSGRRGGGRCLVQAMRVGKHRR